MSIKQIIWNTSFTQAFQCRLPILSAPMADVSGGLLAAEVTKAGGLGMIAAGHFQYVDQLEAEIGIFKDRMRSETVRSASKETGSHHSDLAIGFIGFSSLATPSGWVNYEHILRKYRPKAVLFFAPAIIAQQGGPSNVQLAHEHGVKFIAQVGSINEAKEAIQHKVDAIICQGSEAGGHGLRRELGNSTMALASQTSKMTNIPVLAAGGVVNGKHIASFLCVCDGVSMGTRYWACKESLGNEQLQNELAKDNSCDDVIRTAVFDQIHNELSTFQWPHPYNSTAALRNQTAEEWDGKSSKELQYAIDNTRLLEEYQVSREMSDANVVPVLAGEGVGEINSIEGASEITLKLEGEAIDTLDRLRSLYA
mmetsp:Transcript_14500/g.25495  ORF Transcript_14500/g.25495 Transcript_14500/m.25495 type:complete len:366 (-) Transcript_14500:20-1117(-)